MNERVVYVVVADPGETTPSETFERWPTAGRTLAALARTGVDVVGVARSGGDDETHYHDGVEWRFVADRSRSAWRIAGAVAALRPAVVHVNGVGFARAWAAIRVRCGRGTRIVVQHHGELPGRGRVRFAQRAVRRVTDAYLFTGGHAQAAAFVAAGVLRADTPVFDVLESSADVAVREPVDAREATGMTGEPSVIAVGRLVPGKDPLTLLRGFLRFARQSPDAELWWLYGDNALETAVRAELATGPQLAARVHLVGRVPAEQVGVWLSVADVFVSASLHEGSGYALIEAISAGCTPVVSDIAPHRAIAGTLGERFPIGDADALATALADVIVDRAAAQERFAQQLTWEHVAVQLVAAYRPPIAFPYG